VHLPPGNAKEIFHKDIQGLVTQSVTIATATG
jgi:hypothetical protein